MARKTRAIKSRRLKRQDHSREVRKGLYQNWYGYIRVFRPVKKLTPANVDRYLDFTTKDLSKATKRRKVYSISLFWEIKVKNYSSHTRKEVEEEKITSISTTTTLSIDDLKNFQRDKFIERFKEYKSETYLRKSWAYVTTQTKTRRMKKYVGKKPKKKGRKVSKRNSRTQNRKVFKTKSRKISKRKVRHIRHRGK